MALGAVLHTGLGGFQGYHYPVCSPKARIAAIIKSAPAISIKMAASRGVNILNIAPIIPRRLRAKAPKPDPTSLIPSVIPPTPIVSRICGAGRDGVVGQVRITLDGEQVSYG